MEARTYACSGGGSGLSPSSPSAGGPEQVRAYVVRRPAVFAPRGASGVGSPSLRDKLRPVETIQLGRVQRPTQTPERGRLERRARWLAWGGIGWHFATRTTYDTAGSRSGISPASRARELAERAGHARPSMSLDVYSHVMPPDEIASDRVLALLGD